MPYGPSPSSEPSAKPDRKSRTKSVRITVDLGPADFEVLNRWLAKAAVELDQPLNRMTLARGIRAMIRATATDDVASGVVLDRLRTEDQSR
jgi:imidazolonepropionase-like amidohydrolase